MEKKRNSGLLHLEIAVSNIRIKEEETENKERRRDRAQSWRQMYKNDARQLWKEIEWKQKLHAEIQSTPSNVVHDFFTNIFQSSHLQYLPTLVERENEIKNYSTFSNITDSNICIAEVESAVKKRGRGTSYDGISSDLLTMLPKSIMQCILKLFKSTFDMFYPSAWSRQLLIPIPKTKVIRYPTQN